MFYTYILVSHRNGTTYTGHADDLARRAWEHRESVYRGFTSKYEMGRLVWHEVHDSREAAFQRERQIKKWRRPWKLSLIESMNPDWLDLYETLNC